MDAEKRIIELCTAQIDGSITEAALAAALPSEVSAQQRVAALNRLLSLGNLELLKNKEGIVYRLKENVDLRGSNIDMDEKLVFTVIKDAGNKGIWTRDITQRTNVKSQMIAKTLKSLETKKLIKSVAAVNANNKKKVYMLFDLEPDRSITGGAWYSGKEFESEFVEILNEQCYHYLRNKKANAANNVQGMSNVVDPIMRRNASGATSTEMRDYIKNLGISRVDLNQDDIETILNTLVFDGKAERSVVVTGANEQLSVYRVVEPIVPPQQGSPYVRTPCGICPVFENCHPDSIISPQKCIYMKEWLEY